MESKSNTIDRIISSLNSIEPQGILLLTVLCHLATIGFAFILIQFFRQKNEK